MAFLHMATRIQRGRLCRPAGAAESDPWRFLALAVVESALTDYGRPGAAPKVREDAKEFLTGAGLEAWAAVAEIDPVAVREKMPYHIEKRTRRSDAHIRAARIKAEGGG